MKFFITFCLLCFGLSFQAQEKLVVYFDFDEFNLNNSEISKIEKFIQNKNTLMVTSIYGFCDYKGSIDYNDSLSVKRVNTVYDFLVKNNTLLVSDFIVLKGFGKQFKQNKTQYLNRKVIIEYVSNNNFSKFEDFKIGESLVLKNLYFYNNSGVFVPKSEPVLNNLLQILKENPTLKIEIQGHICCQINTDVQDIAKLRAIAVCDFLISNGINKNRLRYVSYGSSKPIHKIPEKSEEEKNENRRVEVLVLEK